MAVSLIDAGLPSDPASLNRTCGAAVTNFSKAFDDCNSLNAMLNDADRYGGSAGLQAKGMGQPAADLLVASFADIHALYLVAHGQQQQVGNNDFFFHAKLLMGTTPVG